MVLCGGYNCDSTAIRPPYIYNSHSTAVQPHCDHSTTYVTIEGLPPCCELHQYCGLHQCDLKWPLISSRTGVERQSNQSKSNRICNHRIRDEALLYNIHRLFTVRDSQENTRSAAGCNLVKHMIFNSFGINIFWDVSANDSFFHFSLFCFCR